MLLNNAVSQLGLGVESGLLCLDPSNYERLKQMRIRRARSAANVDAYVSLIWWRSHREDRRSNQRAIAHWFLRPTNLQSGLATHAYEKVAETIGTTNASRRLIESEKMWAQYAMLQKTGTDGWARDPVSSIGGSSLEQHYRLIAEIDRRITEERPLKCVTEPPVQDDGAILLS